MPQNYCKSTSFCNIRGCFTAKWVIFLQKLILSQVLLHFAQDSQIGPFPGSLSERGLIDERLPIELNDRWLIEELTWSFAEVCRQTATAPQGKAAATRTSFPCSRAEPSGVETQSIRNRMMITSFHNKSVNITLLLFWKHYIFLKMTRFTLQWWNGVIFTQVSSRRPTDYDLISYSSEIWFNSVLVLFASVALLSCIGKLCRKRLCIGFMATCKHSPKPWR